MGKTVKLPLGSFTPVPYTQVTVIDTETTGLYPYGIMEDGSRSKDLCGPDRLCSLTLLRLYRTNKGWKRVWSQTWKVNPGRPVNEAASKINNFKWSMSCADTVGYINLAELNPFTSIVDEVRKLIDDTPIVCHNTVFDYAVLDSEFDRLNVPRLSNPAICTKKAFSDIQGRGRQNCYVKGTSLDALCDYLKVNRDMRKVHTSRIDTDLTADCFIKLDKAGWLNVDNPVDFPHYTFEK